MPRPHPPEFRRRAVELANQRDENGIRLQTIARTAEELGISESCLRNWMTQAAVDAGQRDGLTSTERTELVALRRRTRVLETENEILKRAARATAANVCRGSVMIGRLRGGRRPTRQRLQALRQTNPKVFSRA